MLAGRWLCPYQSTVSKSYDSNILEHSGGSARLFPRVESICSAKEMQQCHAINPEGCIKKSLNYCSLVVREQTLMVLVRQYPMMFADTFMLNRRYAACVRVVLGFLWIQRWFLLC